MLFKVNFNDRLGVYATATFEADDPQAALDAGRAWALEHIAKRPLRMTIELPEESHGDKCTCRECAYSRSVGRIHRDFARGVLTSTEYAERLRDLSQKFLAAQLAEA